MKAINPLVPILGAAAVAVGGVVLASGCEREEPQVLEPAPNTVTVPDQPQTPRSSDMSGLSEESRSATSTPATR